MKSRFSKLFKYSSIVLSALVLTGLVVATNFSDPVMYLFQPDAYALPDYYPWIASVPLPVDTPTTQDSLKFPFDDRIADPMSLPYDHSPLYLGDPSNIKTNIEYDPDNNQYNINEMIGSEFYRNPSYLTYDEYVRKTNAESTKKYWQQLSEGGNSIIGKKGLNPRLYVGSEVFERIFGSNVIDIRPQGSAELTFGANIATNRNPGIPQKQQRTGTFDFKEKIQLNVVGNIGDKMKLSTSYNTEASFDFENRMKLEYTGHDDEIIKKIEAGNVSLPLTGTLITGSQSLFGFKAQLQFGKVLVTGLFSQQKGKSQNIVVPPGGGQKNDFEITCDNYEANKHFFLAQYFRDSYDQALKNVPVISSPITVTKLEVWVVKPGLTDTRSLIGFMDLGESDPYSNSTVVTSGPLPAPTTPLPDNNANQLYYNFNDTSQIYHNLRNPSYANSTSIYSNLANLTVPYTAPRDYERIENAVKLQPSEYTFNPQLGYVSLRSQLNPNQVLAVAYEYSYKGTVYRVGDLTIAGISPPNRLFVKILKSSNVNILLPTWDLMMKNIYALGAYGLQQKDFKLDVLYYNDSTGSDVNFLPAGTTEPNVNSIALIKVMNLDRLNQQLDLQPDGIFDFVEGLTVNASDGRIIFPAVEPFGSYLKTKFNPNTNVYKKYVFQELYDSSKTAAQQITEKNKFKIKGSYVSNVSSDISLNAINIPIGSVKVTAGGIPLIENVDFTVDYNLGRVKIINQSYLNSASPINISLESNSLFSIQSKRLMGVHVDYLRSKDFTLGGTILNLTERPLTQKINVGDEPISNTIIGVDGNYRTDSRFITKLIDKLPLLATKEISNVNINGEYAQFFPGHPKIIGSTGTSYIDDFEGTQSNIDLTTAGSWYLASVPQNQVALFPETNTPDNRSFGVNRAKLAWYQVDPTVFYQNSSIKPNNISDEELSNNQVRQVFESEIFPLKSYPNGVVPPLRVLNLAYYPKERGPYNFDVEPTSYSSGININGDLENPASRWGGIMRNLQTNDFEAANVEFISLWVMDPFNEDNPNPTNKGKLYFNLGQVSEDILHDGQRMYENGLPSNTLTSQVANTDWGVYPTNTTNPTNAFDNDATSRTQQDVGLDGLPTALEGTFVADAASNKKNFLDSISAKYGTSSGAYTLASTDPATDNFRFFRGNTTSDSAASILYRYKDYNGTEANSPVATASFAQSSTNQPDAEDINRDNNMDIYENYYQYEVDIDPAKLAIGGNYVNDIVKASFVDAKGNTRQVKWFQFKIPVRDYTKQVGDIQNFNSIGYIRMFMKGFTEPIVMRFGRLDLTRGEWRRFQAGVGYGCDAIDPIPPFSSTEFNVGAVSIEENANKLPFNYVVPPGITRELNAQTQQAQQLNEQSLSLRMCELFDGDGRATYKNTQLDLRTYKKIKMYVHCEQYDPTNGTGPALPLKDNDLTVFVRIGSDLTQNFYEYEMPLKVSVGSKSDPDLIWPEQNNVEIQLSDLLAAKQKRNDALADPSSGITIQTFYPVITSSKSTIYVVGSPNLSEARSIMIGVRNPKQNCPQFPQYNNDDGLSKCAEVWVNELRLTDFDEQGGWAANARIVTKLANLGTLSISGRRSTFGFGMIEQKITDRSRQDVTAYAVLSQLNLGKFFPDKWGIALPFGFEYGEEFIKPQFDPLQPDVLFNQALDAEKANGDTKTFKQNRIDYTKRKGFNFSNVQKSRTGGGKSHLWDVENFNFTYAYTEVYHRNINIQYDILKNYLGQVGYNFNASPKNWQPFKSATALKSKWLRLIKDFNVTPLPSSLNFNSSINRQYGETLLRNNTSFQAVIDTTFNKYWNWMRTYDIKWDLTKSVKLDFNAMNTSKVDEPNGRIDTEEEKKIVRANFWNGGRNTNYNQSGNASWQVPLNKIPILDWVQVNARYGFDYSWIASPAIIDSVTQTFIPNPILQNTIQNSNTKSLNGTFTFTQLYNKLPFFKRLLAPPAPTPKTVRPPKAEVPKVPGDTSKTAKPPKVPGQINPAIKFVGKMILCVKSAGLNYSETNGTAMPGYIPKTQFLGQEYNYRSSTGKTSNAPGLGFTVGSQTDLRVRAAQYNWLTTDTLFNSQYSQNYTQSFTGRGTIEPFEGMRIELNTSKNYSVNRTENYRINANTGEYNSFNALQSGNFSISTIAWATAFTKVNKDYTNSTFDEFSKNRLIVSQRLGADNPYSNGIDTAGYDDGYSGSSQEVISASFYSAYTGKNAATEKLNPLSLMPLPNWRVTYDGFSKMKWSQKYFQNFQLTHSYRCTYNVNSFNTNLQYSDPGNTGHSLIRDLATNFIPKYDIVQVSITESFAPLIGVDMTLKGKSQFNIRAEYKRDRNLSLTYTGVQLTEIRGNEFTFGTGYRISKLKLPFKFGGKKITLQNDLVLNFDFSYRKSLNVLRRMIEQTTIPSSGMKTYGIKFDADYQINDRFDVRFYWDTIINQPLIATSYPNSNTAFGFSVRFSLSQ